MPFTELETNLFSAMELNLKSDVLTISARGGSVKIKSELPVSDCEDGTLSAIGFVKDGTLNKKAVSDTFRALADFYEKEI